MTAKFNLIKNGIKNFDLIVSDWGLSLNRTFDIIISNPPYIKTNHICGKFHVSRELWQIVGNLDL